MLSNSEADDEKNALNSVEQGKSGYGSLEYDKQHLLCNLKNLMFMHEFASKHSTAYSFE